MSDEEILKLAFEKGKTLIIEAKGPPAKILACGIATSMVVAAGTYVYGRKAVSAIRSRIFRPE